jgi:hypothetical protein
MAIKPNYTLCRKCPHLIHGVYGSYDAVHHIAYNCTITPSTDGHKLPDEWHKITIGKMRMSPTEFAAEFLLNPDFQPPTECPYILEHVMQ